MLLSMFNYHLICVCKWEGKKMNMWVIMLVTGNDYGCDMIAKWT